MIGQTLGNFEVLDKLGEGGMGEVYKARDTRLDRTVAIKVLPSHLADNPDLKQRFGREARAVSSLNHSHICTLHDVGEQDGVNFLVMEYIEGESLADRLKKGALPLEQALRYAIEVADALDKAHRQGVVHRDLKPGNIMLTKSGAKLLDFGLAKFRTDVSAETSSVLSALPTEEKPLTEKGAILGTFQYMAPEQLEGKDADARTDIFALGAVLYEMVTGKRAFVGKSQASLISAIMKDDPPAVSTIQPLTPAAMDYVVKISLAKEQDERWQSAWDLRRILLEVNEWSRADTASPGPVSHRSWRWLLGAAAVTMAALLGMLVGSTLTGRELFYRNGRRWMAVSVTTNPTFAADTPRLLFEGDYLNVPGLSYDVSHDGKRFLLIQPLETSPPTDLRVVLNWFEELERLVPTEN